MDKNYFMVHFNGCKKVDVSTYENHMKNASDRDIITWYDDGKNIFFGGAACDEAEVMAEILYNIGVIELEFCMWGI